MAEPQQRVFGIATAGVQKEKKAGSGKGGNADAEAVMAPGPSVSPDQAARQAKATAAKAGAPKGTEQGTGPAATTKCPVVAGSAGAVKHADVRHEVCTTMCRCSILDSSSDVLSTMRTPLHLAGVTTTLYCSYGTHASPLCSLMQFSVSALHHRDPDNLQYSTGQTYFQMCHDIILPKDSSNSCSPAELLAEFGAG